MYFDPAVSLVITIISAWLWPRSTGVKRMVVNSLCRCPQFSRAHCHSVGSSSFSHSRYSKLTQSCFPLQSSRLRLCFCRVCRPRFRSTVCDRALRPSQACSMCTVRACQKRSAQTAAHSWCCVQTSTFGRCPSRRLSPPCTSWSKGRTSSRSARRSSGGSTALAFMLRESSHAEVFTFGVQFINGEIGSSCAGRSSQKLSNPRPVSPRRCRTSVRPQRPKSGSRRKVARFCAATTRPARS